MKLRKLMAGLAGIALALSMAACSQERPTDTPSSTGSDASSAPAATGGELIGIAMPTKALERWNIDGTNLATVLEGMGYTTTLQYADNEIDQQISQIQNMINQGAKVLVIASIDGSSLTTVLQEAADKGIAVIAYDRLLHDTENVDYYVTFDNGLVGTMQGEYIEKALDLKNAAGPFNLEPFAGSPDDSNAGFFFAGAWDVLSPYVASGKLVVPSGKAPASNDDWQSIGIQKWDSATAQSEMQNRLNSFYTGGTKVDVVLSPNDSLALGIAQALESAGYAPGSDWPILTGQDADLANTKNILDGKQSMSVWKDFFALGDQAAKMVDQIVKGQTVDVNDTSTYDNGVKNVPTYQLMPMVVDADNVESALVDSGFYTAAQLGL